MIRNLHDKRLEYSHLMRLNNRRNVDADEPESLRKDKEEFIHALEMEIKELTDKLKELENIDKRNEKITYIDLEMVLQHYGMTASKRYIDTMIWEVDENCDCMIDYDEYLLTYYR
jgi:Ca2+-binding EF-hand superfamily protein